MCHCRLNCQSLSSGKVVSVFQFDALIILRISVEVLMQERTQRVLLSILHIVQQPAVIVINIAIGFPLYQIQHTKPQIVRIDLLHNLPTRDLVFPCIDRAMECIIQIIELLRIGFSALEQFRLIFQAFPQFHEQDLGTLICNLTHQLAFHTPSEIDDIQNIVIVQLGHKSAPLRIN